MDHEHAALVAVELADAQASVEPARLVGPVDREPQRNPAALGAVTFRNRKNIPPLPETESNRDGAR